MIGVYSHSNYAHSKCILKDIYYDKAGDDK